ncbi:insulin-degrading enzyme-like 1 peroxisomal [Fagus crenata]
MGQKLSLLLRYRRVGPTEEVEEIVKARSDKREYRRILLKNSLEALLISDPDTDKAIHSFFIFHSTFFGPSSYSQSSSGLIFFQCAASMSVSVGSFSDPDGLEGLAHFLEHMLFYASEKYPLEDSYYNYIVE